MWTVSYAYISAVNIKGNLSGKFPSRCLCKQRCDRLCVRWRRQWLTDWRGIVRQVSNDLDTCDAFITNVVTLRIHYCLSYWLLPAVVFSWLNKVFVFLFILRSYPDVVSCLERMWNSATRRVALYTETCCTCEHTLRCDNHEKHWRVS